MLDGHIKHHPAEDLDTPQKFSYLPKFLTEEEIDRLFATPDVSTEEGIRDRAMLELMYAAGLRVSELVSLKQTEVDVHAGVVNCHGKGSKERRVPVGKSAIHWLQQYASVKAAYGQAAYPNLFLNRGKPLTRQFAWTTIRNYAAGDWSAECFAPHFAPQLCNSSLATRRRLAFGPSFAWPQRYFYNSNLHAHYGSPPAHGLRQSSSARASCCHRHQA